MREVLKRYMSRVEQKIAEYSNEEITESSAMAMIGMLEAWDKIHKMLDNMK